MNEQKMQNKDFEKLRKIGIDQIKKDTKLDLARISDILEKRFEKFDYVRAKGFINILEKEYKLDLSDWLEEYLLSNPPRDREENTQELQEEYCKQLKQKKQIFVGISVGMIGLIAFVCLYLFTSNTLQFKQEIHQALNTQNKSVETLNDVSAQEVSKAQQEDAQALDVQTKVEVPIDTEINQSPFIGKSVSELGSFVFEDLTIAQESILSFQFERPIWVGIIELETKKKKAQTQEEYNFSLEKDMLFYVAYGNFLLSIEGEEKRYKTYNPIFLIYTKEGGLKQLTKDEYLFINGGSEW